MAHPSERIYTRWPSVEAYCTPLSVAAGEPVGLHVAGRAATCSVEVRRWGAAEPAWTTSGLAAVDHPVPERAFEHGCGWPVTVSIPTETSWPSGLYEVTLVADDEQGDAAVSQAMFVVRARAGEPGARALLHLATNTYNAYNQWGGRCLYSGATQVSFERPLERGYLRRPTESTGYDGRFANIETPSDPTHQRVIDYQERFEIPMWTGSAGWWNWERRFVEWAEAAGFGLDVAIDADLETVPDLLDDYDVLLTVGHNEYWTRGMRDAVDGFVDRGGRWAIFGGNTCFWQVRIDHTAGHMTGFKGRARTEDPVVGTADEHLLTTIWADPLLAHPETSTTGLTFSRGGYHRVGLAVDGFVDRGGRWAIFGGNTCFWQVRIDHGNGHMTGFKGRARTEDPVVGTADEHLLTTIWADPLLAHPETSTTGLTFSRGGYHRVGLAVGEGTGAYRVHRPDHWAFEGTGLGDGDLLGAGSFVVAYEVDGCALEWVDGHPRPTHEDGAPASLEILATAPARLVSVTDDVCEPPPLLWDDIEPPGELEEMAQILFGSMDAESVERIAQGHAVMGHFTRGAGEVFNIGSTDWAYGLDHDPQVQTVTSNILRRFGVDRGGRAT
jgi:hypothetical protein